MSKDAIGMAIMLIHVAVLMAIITIHETIQLWTKLRSTGLNYFTQNLGMRLKKFMMKFARR